MKKKIGVRSVVDAKVGDMEDNMRYVRIRRIMKEVVVCVHDLVGKNNLLVQFEYGKKREISCILLSYVCLKEEVCLDMDEPISYLPKKEQGGVFTIEGYPVFE